MEGYGWFINMEGYTSRQVQRRTAAASGLNGVCVVLGPKP